MPIFLLPDLAAALLKLSGRLADWGRLAPIEEQLLRRARSAFLVRWFGTGIPERNLNLLIHIDNMREFSDRYQLAERSRQRNNDRLNLLGPLAGLVGVTAGIIFNPTGGTLIGALVRLFDEGFNRGSFAAIFGEIVYRIFIEHGSIPFWVTVAGAAILLVTAPLALGLALVGGMGGEPRVRAVYNLLGAVAMLVDAFLGFWRNVTGPLDQIRNPLVRRVVGLLHRITALIFQVVGFASLLVTHLVPILPSLVAQFRAMMALGQTVYDIVDQMLTGIAAALRAPFEARGGIEAILTGIFGAISALPTMLMDMMTALFDGVVAEVTAAYTHIRGLLGEFIAGLKASILAAFDATPLGLLKIRIDALLVILPQVKQAFSAMPGPPPPPATPPWYSRAASAVWSGIKWAGTHTVDNLYLGNIVEGSEDLFDAIDRVALPARPTLPTLTIPDLPALPDRLVIDAGLLPPAATDLRAARDALMAEARTRAGAMPLPPELLRNPRSAFADQRAALNAMGPPTVSPAEAALRDMVYLALGRVLPPALRDLAPTVRHMFDQIDHHLYGAARPPETEPDIPQLELPDQGRLQPQIRMLSIRSHRGMPADLRAFQTMLVTAMNARDYRVAASG